MSSKARKQHSDMSPAELDKIAAKSAREFVADEVRPLTLAMKRRHQAARKRGRPRVGQETESIS